MDAEHCKYFVQSIFVLLITIVDCRGRIEWVDLHSALVFSFRGCGCFHARRPGRTTNIIRHSESRLYILGHQRRIPTFITIMKRDCEMHVMRTDSLRMI